MKPRTLADMEPVLAKIAVWDYSQPRDPLYEFTLYLQTAIPSRSELLQIEARLIRMLASETSLTGKDWVCRQLGLIGTEASVSRLAAMLGDPATSEMARYALERIPAPEAIDALRTALPKASGKAQAGIITSLGQRRDARSVAALRGLATGPASAAHGARRLRAPMSVAAQPRANFTSS
jgi:HEAT repeat protein